MGRITVDGSRIASREEFFEAVRVQIGRDRLIGSNLDALHDVLTSVTSYTVIEILSREKLEEALGDWWKKVLWVINDCLDENKNLKLDMPDR